MQFPQLNYSSYYPYLPNYPHIPSFDELVVAFRNIHEQKVKFHNQLFYEYEQFCRSNNLIEGDINNLKYYYQKRFLEPPNPIANPNPIPNNKNMQSTNNNIYVNDQTTSILPRKEVELHEGPKGSKDQKLMNITFSIPSGHKVVFVVKNDTTVNELIIKYMSKLGLSYDYIKNREVEFLYGAQRIDPFSKVPISSVFINNIIIHVVERRIVIGA